MSKILIVGNWKMNLNTHQASLYLHKLDGMLKAYRDVEVVICPNTLVLQSLSLQVDHRKMKLGAQNCYWRDEGPYTGEVSATMLHGVVDYVLVGHSERRHVFGESESDIRAKVQAVLRNGLRPILCVGETAQEKAEGETEHVLHEQVVSGLANVTSEEMERVVIAYEPVWAISHGTDFAGHVSATPEQADAAAQLIRRQIKALYGPEAADQIRVLYGASVSPENAVNYLGLPSINGLLAGGASLQADTFAALVTAAHQSAKSTEKGAT